MGELALQLLADEVRAGFFDVLGGEELAAEFAEVGASLGGGVLRVAVGVDSEAAFFVHVAVAHGDDDGVDANVHHDDVEG